MSNIDLWSEFPDFSPAEFDSADLPGSGSKMQSSTLTKLQEAREISRQMAKKLHGLHADCPYIINSGFRTPEHNEKEGGSSNSSHLKGHAVDIAAKSSRDRYLILMGLLQAGFHRIGIGNTFIHADDDYYKDARVIWLYD